MPRPWLSLVLLRASLLFWTSLVLWPQVMGRTAMGMAAAVGTSPVTLTSGHPDLLGFCTGRPSGVHCHPDRGQWRVWCPPPVTTTGKVPTGSDDTTARLLPCPADHICRAHHKLQSVVVQGEGRGIGDNTTAAVPQCVPTDKTDLDAFCEDKLYSVMAARSDAAAVALDELRQRYVETMMSDAVANASSLIAGDSVLMAVRQCNPFNAQRKQLLDCVVVQRACAVDLNEGVVGAEKACLASNEIQLFIDECPSYDVCRKYEEEEGAQGTMAKCISPVDAMCQDRFWSVFAAGVAESGRLKGDSPLAMTSALAIPASAEAETTSIRFRFCDPYKSREQIECHMDLSVHRRPRSRHSSIGSSPLSEIERISFMDRIRRNFPELHAKLRPKSSARNNIVISGRAGDSVTEQRATISVNSIHVDRHFCSANVSRHGDRPEWISMESNGGYVDPWLIHDGPVCKQLTQRLTRCLPRASISIPRSALEDPRPVPQTSRAAAAVSSDDATSVTPQVVLRPESEVGFCTGHAPGQYCIPGTPELAIQCPQGKILRCPRPRATDPAVFSDVGTRSQRCVQMFGAIPGQAGNAAPEKTDAFRKHVIKDVFGREQESGWWARCAYAEA